jgi:hypothetical protein
MGSLQPDVSTVSREDLERFQKGDPTRSLWELARELCEKIEMAPDLLATFILKDSDELKNLRRAVEAERTTVTDILALVESEEELPGPMPESAKQAFLAHEDISVPLRLLVKGTKQSIIHRIKERYQIL